MKEFTLSELGVFLGVVGGIVTSVLLTIQVKPIVSKAKGVLNTSFKCRTQTRNPSRLGSVLRAFADVSTGISVGAKCEFRRDIGKGSDGTLRTRYAQVGYLARTRARPRAREPPESACTTFEYHSRARHPPRRARATSTDARRPAMRRRHSPHDRAVGVDRASD